MAFSHGKNAHFTIDDSGGIPRDISAYCNSIDFPRTADTAETSTFGNTSKTYVVGLVDATISIEGAIDPTGDGYLAGILGTAAGDFVYGPNGSTAGYIKYSGTCICTAYSVGSPIGDKVGFTASFQVSGDVTRGTFT